MKIDVFDFDEFVDFNMLSEITNPIMINKDHHPTDDGLLSYRIFGRTQKDRKNMFAYIDLGDQFLHPAIYKSLMRVNRKIELLVGGLAYFKLDENKELIECNIDDKGAGTGLDFLYKNIKKINFRKTDSNLRDERISLIKLLSIKELFTSKMLVVPPFIRDINLKNVENGKVSYDELNQLYSQLLSYSLIVKDSKDFAFAINRTKGRIQMKMVEIYDYFIDQKVAHKNGHLKRNVQSKATDYSNRLVLSPPRFNYETVHDNPIDYKHTGLPLSSCMSLFLPYVIRWVKEFFSKELINNGKYPRRKDGKVIYENIKDAEYYTSAEFIKKQIDKYIKYPSERFQLVTFITESGDEIKTKLVGELASDDIRPSTTHTPMSLRYLTWTDIFYLACEDVTKDKYILATRYPISDHYSSYVSKIHVSSTIETEAMYINNRFYKYYPKINLDINDKKILSNFIDTMQPCVIYLKGLGADFDGDQMTIRGLWSKESNLEAAKMMMSPLNLLGINGKINRSVENEAAQALYSSTKINR